MDALRFSPILSRGSNNDTIRKNTNVYTIKYRIKELKKFCYENSVIKNPDIQEFFRTAVPYPYTPFQFCRGK